MYAIENTTSLEIISSIIKWYDTLDYTAYSLYLADHKPPLFVAIALNKFDFANLLIENKASVDYASKYVYYHCGNLNNENLCFMIDVGFRVSNDLLFDKFNKLIKVNNNDLVVLEKYLKQFLKVRHENHDLDEFPEKPISTQKVQRIFYKIIKADNYYLIEKSFDYCGDNEVKRLLDILDKLFRLFDGFNKYLHQNKKDAFLNNIRNKDLKNKVKFYFELKEILDRKRKRILDIAKAGHLAELQQYIYDNKIELKSLNDEHFDILISAIENKVPVKIIKYIISQCHYHDFDYYITYMDDFLKIHFIEEICTLNFENLKYILNHGFDVCDIHGEIIKDFIYNDYFDTFKVEDIRYNEYSNSFLEIFLKNIKKEHYDFAIKNNNITALIILLYYDKNNKNDVLLNFNYSKDNIFREFKYRVSFYECNFYCKISNENGYIDRKIFLDLESNINEFYQSFNEKEIKLKIKFLMKVW